MHATEQHNHYRDGGLEFEAIMKFFYSLIKWRYNNIKRRCACVCVCVFVWRIWLWVWLRCIIRRTYVLSPPWNSEAVYANIGVTRAEVSLRTTANMSSWSSLAMNCAKMVLRNRCSYIHWPHNDRSQRNNCTQNTPTCVQRNGSILWVVTYHWIVSLSSAADRIGQMDDSTSDCGANAKHTRTIKPALQTVSLFFFHKIRCDAQLQTRAAHH